MESWEQVADEHTRLARRYFLGLTAAGMAAAPMASLFASEGAVAPELAEAIAKLRYLTPDEDFINFGRGTPPPHTLPPERLREVGLHPDTWRLEVISDPESDAELGRPLTKADGTALDWNALMALAETKSVRFLHVTSCTNGRNICGMGVWEGVPLREVVWMARPAANVRRVYYYGYHNDDSAQRFQGSLTLGRVLEDPPGEYPVILCYKLNGDWLTAKRGGPVRILVPGEYGNKSVKWVQRIVLTNTPQANDTYAEWNNDTESPIKTCARFVFTPERARAGEPIPVTGLAQVGMAGLSKVQYSVRPAGAPVSEDDPYFIRADWQDADLLPPPEHWGDTLPGGKLPERTQWIDPGTGRPAVWPMRYSIANWAALVPAQQAGKYEILCRTIDANGVAQPMPRPYKKSGNNAIQVVKFEVAG